MKKNNFNKDNVIKLLKGFITSMEKAKKLNESYDHGCSCFKEFAKQVRKWYYANEITTDDIIELQNHGIEFMKVDGLMNYIRKNETSGLFYSDAIELSQKLEFLKLTIAEQKGYSQHQLLSLIGDIESIGLFYNGIYPSKEIEFFKSLPDCGDWDKKRVLKLYEESGIKIEV